MSYTERELAEALQKALHPETLPPTQKAEENRKLVESLRPILENIPYLGATKNPIKGFKLI